MHRFNETRSVEEEGCSLLQEQLLGLKSLLSLHRDRAVSSVLLLSWWKMHEVFLVQRAAGSWEVPVMNLAPGAWGSFLPSLWGGWRVPRAGGGTGFRELWF